MRQVKLGQEFPLVIAPFNCILHLYERSDVESFFARVKEHLMPGGRFVFDFSLPQPADLARDPDKTYGAPRYKDPTTGKLVRYAERFEYDLYRQLLLVRMQLTPEGEAPHVVPLTHRQFFPRRWRRCSTTTASWTSSSARISAISPLTATRTRSS